MKSLNTETDSQRTGWSRLRAKRFARRALFTGLWTANFAFLAFTLWGFVVSDAGYDWRIFEEAGQRVWDGRLYVWEERYAWTYSPLLAYAFAALAPIGYFGWSVLHVAALGLIGNWRMAATVFVSWPFWADLYNGNTSTFVFVAAAGAMRGNAVGTASFFLLSLLIPRPLMIPLVAWLLWKRPSWRLPFAGMILANALLVLMSGYGPAWFDVLVGVPSVVSEISQDPNSGVLFVMWWSSWLGLIWLPIAFILAAFLTWQQRLGWASLAASPYWLPQYLMMALLEMIPISRESAGRPAESTDEWPPNPKA